MNDVALAFELNNNQTSTYEEVIQFYTRMAQYSDLISIAQAGLTDIGLPLHEVIISTSKNPTPSSERQLGKTILFINNGIHPGEPDGIDATMLFVKDIIQNKSLSSLLDKVTIVIIPVYNIDGALNRGSFSRANQNGPESYGFRANAKNLDLNRDFIKCDSKNARSFSILFTKWQPDLMVDTHTSNGADYPYTMTLISTQKDKLQLIQKEFLTKSILPYLYSNMAAKGWEMVPYVYSESTPEKGIVGFFDHPRYSSGYAALHHTISFMPETHMLKPYKDRVISTKLFLETIYQYANHNYQDILAVKQHAIQSTKSLKKYPLSYNLDKSSADLIQFKAFSPKMKTSAVTNLPRLYYDKDDVLISEIPYYNSYIPTNYIDIPYAYVIPQAYENIIQLLQSNGVEVVRLISDKECQASWYSIEKYKTTPLPYESHYLHSDVQVSTISKFSKFRKGDYVIFTNQNKLPFIIETLEPQAADSYFAWNYFDGVLSQKEHFSDYVFDDLAQEIINNNPTLKNTLENKKKEDPNFAKDHYAQLEFIYKNSPYYEKTHNLYPIAKIVSQNNWH